MAWDIATRIAITGGGAGTEVIFHEFDYKTPRKEVYASNGVTITAFPALHCLDGPNSYSLGAYALNNSAFEVLVMAVAASRATASASWAATRHRCSWRWCSGSP